jgi:hypothetical protein
MSRASATSYSLRSARGHRIEVAADEHGDMIVHVDGAALIPSDRRKIETAIDELQSNRLATNRAAIAARCLKSK